MYSGCLTDVDGLLVGHATDRAARTGVTAILCPDGAVAGVDVRGGGPGTRETDAMQPGRLVEKIHAVLLSGGSAFGLDAAGGAMNYLERKGIGFDTGYARVPIVGGAVLFDLGVGSSHVRPDAPMGALACLAAGRAFEQGAVGAGAGATVGKLLPGACPTKSGLGSASLRLPDASTLAALVAVNAAGDVYHPETGALMGAGRMPGGQMTPALGAMIQSGNPSSFAGNTTIGVIATDARLTASEASRLALLAHDGYARCIRPVHLPVDGDAAFCLATGRREGNFLLLCALAAEVVARAIANALTAAGAGEGAPC